MPPRCASFDCDSADRTSARGARARYKRFASRQSLAHARELRLAMGREPIALDIVVKHVNEEIEKFERGLHEPPLKSDEFSTQLLEYIDENKQSYVQRFAPELTLVDTVNRDGSGLVPADVHNARGCAASRPPSRHPCLQRAASHEYDRLTCASRASIRIKYSGANVKIYMLVFARSSRARGPDEGDRDRPGLRRGEDAPRPRQGDRRR